MEKSENVIVAGVDDSWSYCYLLTALAAALRCLCYGLWYERHVRAIHLVIPRKYIFCLHSMYGSCIGQGSGVRGTFQLYHFTFSLVLLIRRVGLPPNDISWHTVTKGWCWSYHFNSGRFRRRFTISSIVWYCKFRRKKKMFEMKILILEKWFFFSSFLLSFCLNYNPKKIEIEN